MYTSAAPLIGFSRPTEDMTDESDDENVVVQNQSYMEKEDPIQIKEEIYEKMDEDFYEEVKEKPGLMVHTRFPEIDAKSTPKIVRVEPNFFQDMSASDVRTIEIMAERRLMEEEFWITKKSCPEIVFHCDVKVFKRFLSEAKKSKIEPWCAKLPPSEPPYEECQLMRNRNHDSAKKRPRSVKFICWVAFFLTILILIAVGIFLLLAKSKSSFDKAIPLKDQGQPKTKSILIIGGTTNHGQHLRSVLSFEPSKGGRMAHFEEAELQNGRAGHVAQIFGDKIIVAGGTQQVMEKLLQQPTITTTTELIVVKNTSEYSLSVGAPMNQKRLWTTGAVHGDKLFICGTTIKIREIGSCEKYSPMESKWTNDVAVIHQNRRVYKGPMVALGRYIYLFSPNQNSKTFHAKTTLRYDTVENVWKERAAMKELRLVSAASTWTQQDGTTVIIVCGGYVGQQSKSSCESYDPDTDIWSSFPEMMEKRAGHALVNWHDTLFAIGGFGNKKGEPTDTIERFSSTSGKWVIIDAKLPQGRAEFATVLL